MRAAASELVSEAARSFHEKGYVPVDVLSAGEAARYRDLVLRLRDRAGVDPGSPAWDLPHGVSRTPELWSLIDHPRLLGSVREVLRTCDVIYAEHSALEVRRDCTASEWHRDPVAGRSSWGELSVDRRVVRVACCLESGEDLTWGAIDGSHRGERKSRTWERTLRRLTQADSTWIPVRPGTCVLFDPRLAHAVGPTWETSVTALLAFGANNTHTDRRRRRFACPDNPYKLALYGYLSERGLA